MQDGLGPRVSLFLSDVETDTWSEEQILDVTAASGRVIITLGEKGAVLHENGIISRIPVTPVSQSVLHSLCQDKIYVWVRHIQDGIFSLH